MTRTTRRSVDKDRPKAEEMPPPPPPAAKPPTATLPEQSEAPITVHKRIRAPLLDKVFERSLKASLSGITPEAWNKCFPTPTARRPEQMKEVRKKFCEIYELNVRVWGPDHTTRKNFQDIISSRKLLASLDNLDILVSEAHARKDQFLKENPQAPLPMDPPPKPTPVDKEKEAEKQKPEEKPTEASPAEEKDIKKPEVEAKERNGPPLPIPIHELKAEDLYMSHLYPILQLQSSRLESLKQAQQASIDILIKRRKEQQAEIKELIATLEKRLRVVDEAAEGVKEILEMDGDEEMMEA